MELIYIVLPHVGLFLSLTLCGDLDRRIVEYLVIRICTVGSYRNGVDEIRTFGIIKTIGGCLDQDVVSRPGLDGSVLSDIQ